VKKMRAEMNDMKEQMSNIMARMDAPWGGTKLKNLFSLG
jgi:hypothetical protein